MADTIEMGHHSREDYYRDHYVGNRGAVPSEELDRSIESVAANLTAVLKALRANPLADRLVVFGSMARGSFLPGDIDVAIDLRNGQPPDGEGLSGLLRIARKHYGWLDAFVVEADGTLFVRNDTASGWTRAKNAKALKEAIRSEGRPLHEVSFELDPTPAPYEPIEWEVDRFRKRWEDLKTDGLRPDVLAHWQKQHLIATANHPYREVNDLFDGFAATVPDWVSEGIERPAGESRPMPL